MLRARGERCQMQATERQQDAQWTPIECGHGGGDIRDLTPAVPILRAPGRPCQRQQRDLCTFAGRDRMRAHGRREGMGRINDVGHRVFAQVCHQPLDTSETAAAHRDRLLAGLRHASRVGQHGALAAAGQLQGQRTGLQRAAENKDISHG